MDYQLFIYANLIGFSIFSVIAWSWEPRQPRFRFLAEIWIIYGALLFGLILNYNPHELILRAGQGCHQVLIGDSKGHLIYAGYTCK